MTLTLDVAIRRSRLHADVTFFAEANNGRSRRNKKYKFDTQRVASANETILTIARKQICIGPEFWIASTWGNSYRRESNQILMNLGFCSKSQLYTSLPVAYMYISHERNGILTLFCVSFQLQHGCGGPIIKAGNCWKEQRSMHKKGLEVSDQQVTIKFNTPTITPTSQLCPKIEIIAQPPTTVKPEPEIGRNLYMK